ncbi:MAG: hypothetical protein RSB71_03680 [Bacilli bacterium]
MQRKDISLFKPISEEPRGFTKKYWISDEINKLVKYNNDFYKDQDVMEKLASVILNCLDINVVKVELGKSLIGNCCLIDTFLNDDEVLYEVDGFWAIVESNNVNADIATSFSKVFYKFSKLYNVKKDELENIKKDYIRLILGDCLIGNEDRKLKNVALIFNERTKVYRLAPSFDNALAFHAYNLLDKEAVAYIGNQYFNVTDVMKYLYDNYLDIVEPIMDKVDNFVDNTLVNLLSGLEIDQAKKEYIINYMENIKRRKYENKRY